MLLPVMSILSANGPFAELALQPHNHVPQFIQIDVKVENLGTQLTTVTLVPQHQAFESDAVTDTFKPVSPIVLAIKPLTSQDVVIKGWFNRVEFLADKGGINAQQLRISGDGGTKQWYAGLPGGALEGYVTTDRAPYQYPANEDFLDESSSGS